MFFSGQSLDLNKQNKYEENIHLKIEIDQNQLKLELHTKSLFSFFDWTQKPVLQCPNHPCLKSK